MSASERFSEADKRGWSSYCRREEHKTCRMAQARCGCPCHGGQQEAPKVEATVTPIQPEPEHVCDSCDYKAKSAAGLAIHKGRSHKAKAAPVRTPQAPKPAASKAPEGPWLLVVGDGPVHTALLSTQEDADHVAALLTALGHTPRRFRPVDDE